MASSLAVKVQVTDAYPPRATASPFYTCRRHKRDFDVTLYTNAKSVWTYEQMRDVVFPAQIDGPDMEQFIGGELSFEDWLAESFNSGIYRKVAEEEWS